MNNLTKKILPFIAVGLIGLSSNSYSKDEKLNNELKELTSELTRDNDCGFLSNNYIEGHELDVDGISYCAQTPEGYIDGVEKGKRSLKLNRKYQELYNSLIRKILREYRKIKHLRLLP